MTETAVDLKGVTLTYGPFVAVNNVDLKIDKGSFVTLLHPSPLRGRWLPGQGRVAGWGAVLRVRR
jgi:hypothetical protein